MGSRKAIGILTGGGDCPGLNAVIRAAGKTLLRNGITEIIGIKDGFSGLVEKRIKKLSFEDLSGIMHLGGTIIGTSNKANPFRYYDMKNQTTSDKSSHVMQYTEELGLKGLITIGGDGTQEIAYKFQQLGLSIVAVPKTIDNDLKSTDITFGFDTAVSIVTEGLDRLHTTARSHHRVMILEVMGRNAGWIALHGGVAGGADVILIPEIPYQLDKIIEVCKRRNTRGERYTIIVVAEGAKTETGEQIVSKKVFDSPDVNRLGGIGNYLAKQLEPHIDNEIRVTVLGHLQRGGSPTAFDRNLATTYGVEAAMCVLENDWSKLVAQQHGRIVRVPLKEAIGGQRLVTNDHPLIKSAVNVGTSFGI